MECITRFERTRAISHRALQISQGAKPLTDCDGLRDPIEIAEKEFKEGVIPVIIVRHLPGGHVQKIVIKPKKH